MVRNSSRTARKKRSISKVVKKKAVTAAFKVSF